LVGLTLPFSASAQLYFCNEPSKPSVPSGHFEEHWEMENAQEEVGRYLDEVREYLSCLENEREDAIREAQGVQYEWQDAVNAFNNR
jgi:hypothetical protein